MKNKHNSKPYFTLSAACFAITAISLVVIMPKVLVVSFALGILFAVIGIFFVDDRGGSFFGGMPWDS